MSKCLKSTCNWTSDYGISQRRISFLGLLRSCRPPFEAPHHLEWLVRRLLAPPSRGSQSFCARRCVCACRLAPCFLWWLGAKEKARSVGWAGGPGQAQKALRICFKARYPASSPKS